jgi:hypothetical protein
MFEFPIGIPTPMGQAGGPGVTREFFQVRILGRFAEL